MLGIETRKPRESTFHKIVKEILRRIADMEKMSGVTSHPIPLVKMSCQHHGVIKKYIRHHAVAFIGHNRLERQHILGQSFLKKIRRLGL